MTTQTNAPATELLVVRRDGELPAWLDRSELARFLHDSLKPYEDAIPDIERGLERGLSETPSRGGFVVLAATGERLLGALVMLDTGMSGYIPENLLLFVAVDPATRGQGLGRRIIEHAVAQCDGAVKLHVEYDNPARRLYERLGFTSKYAEMRLAR